MAAQFVRLSLLAGISMLASTPVLAQSAAEAPAKPATAKRVYTPADFARFAPKTAYDMLTQVPSFSIRSADQERGLGQASENVLINGQRIANKSGGAIDELQRTSAASVDRIEIVDAASLGIAGLSGQIANIILRASRAGSGQYEWKPSFRAHYAMPEPLGGSISYSDRAGPVDYTLSVKNDYGRGGFGGPIWISDASGNLRETRHEVYSSEYEQLNMKARLGIDGPGSSAGNLTLGYVPYWNPADRRDTRELVTGELRSRTNHTTLDGYFADINGDYEFALGPGRLKLIGLRHWEHEPLVTTQILRFDSSGEDPNGTRFSRDTHIGETIARGEYHWKSGKNDFQLSLERAFNSLDQKGGLFQLNSDGDFIQVPFPEGTGKVTEVRYESIATFSRPVTSNLDLQVAAGAEISRLDRTPDDEPARKFFRPKGSVTFGWRPAKGWDVSLKLRRRVGQISFYDFLAQPQLSSDRENAGNPDLVPPQSWEAETEFAHDLGPWGKTRLRLWYYRVEDIVDVIPIGENGEGIGNLPRADRYGAESVSTFELAPLGIKGAKLDVTIGREWTSVRDPLTGDKRPISGIHDKWASAQIRHDVPATPWAWSAFVEYNNYAKNYFLTEVYRSLDLPWIAGFYVEHKNLFGLTVRATVNNVFNGRHLLDRTVYTGFRDRNPINFVEKHDQLVGPLFNLSVKGTF
ncbi:MAG: TonB-dependent receptor plug domain-containing protein [Sphingomicrobium sp.]